MMATNPLALFLQERGKKLSDLASSLNINKSTVSRWKRVPAERVIEVEKATGIPREEIRPDIYPADPRSSDGAAA